jgi:hypothetical protein
MRVRWSLPERDTWAEGDGDRRFWKVDVIATRYSTFLVSNSIILGLRRNGVFCFVTPAAAIAPSKEAMRARPSPMSQAQSRHEDHGEGNDIDGCRAMGFAPILCRRAMKMICFHYQTQFGPNKEKHLANYIMGLQHGFLIARPKKPE